MKSARQRLFAPVCSALGNSVSGFCAFTTNHTKSSGVLNGCDEVRMASLPPARLGVPGRQSTPQGPRVHGALCRRPVVAQPMQPMG